MAKISPVDFKPELVSTMKSVLDAAVVHIDKSSGTPVTTAATKAKMASRILKTAAEGITDAKELKSAAIQAGLKPAD